MQDYQIISLEASAGSGKTFNIAKEYLGLLFQGCIFGDFEYYKKILAVTFANKAAYEMKERIICFLKQIEFDRFKTLDEKFSIIGYFKDKFGLDKIKEASKKFLDNILEDYSSFRIKTIDSFFNDIISVYSHKLNLKPRFEVVDDIDPYLKAAINELVDDMHNNIETRNKFLNFSKKALFVENKIDWYPQRKIFKILKDLYHIQRSHGGAFILSNYTTNEIIKAQEFLKRDLECLNNILPKNTNKTFQKSLKNIISQITVTIPKSEFFKYQKFPITGQGDISTKVEILWSKIRQRLKNLYTMILYSQFDPYIELYNLAIEKAKIASINQNVFFISDFNDTVANLLSKNNVPIEEICIKLSANIKHYLIDEFQDSNNLQWENFKPMINEALSQGGSLFLVGDRKQSIYGFRGSNPLLFKNIKEQFSNY